MAGCDFASGRKTSPVVGRACGCYLIAKLQRLAVSPCKVKTFERLHHPNIVESPTQTSETDISEATKPGCVTLCDRARYKHSWLELSRRSEFCPFVPRR